MEPVTTAIVAALVGGAIAATKEVTNKAIVDAYDSLKTLIADRYKRKAVIGAVEEDPTSSATKSALGEALEKSEAVKDAEVITLANKLTAALQELPPAEAKSLGLDIERFKAGQAVFKDILATGTAVHIRDTEVTGGFEASGIRGGVPKN